MNVVYTVIVLAGAVYVLREAFGGGRALHRRVAAAEGASGTAEELLAQGCYDKIDCGFEIKRPARFSAQAFTSLHVGPDDLVLVERGVAYRIRREGAVVDLNRGRTGRRRIIIRSAEFEVWLSPVDRDALVDALRKCRWLT